MGDEKKSEQSGTETETRVETPGGTKITESEAPAPQEKPQGEKPEK